MQDIEKLKIEHINAYNLLVGAEDTLRMAWGAYAQALRQFECARKSFGSIRSRLVTEVMCEEIQGYFECLDDSRNNGGK